MKKILAILVAMVLCLSLIAGCAEKDEKAPVKENEIGINSKILTKIGDYDITQGLFNCYYFITYNDYAQYAQYAGPEWIDQDFGDGKTIRVKLLEDTKTQIAQYTTAAKLAKDRYGITGENVKENVDKGIEELINAYGGRENYEKQLLEVAHITDESLRTYYELTEIWVLLLDKISAEGEELYIPAEEIEESLKAYPKVRHILISTKSADGETAARTDEEAQAIIDDIFKRLENGEDFKALVDELGEDPGMQTNDFYICGQGQMVPEFEEGSASLAIGEYTNPAVKTDYGYHIIKRYGYEPESNEYKNQRYSLVEQKLFPIVDAEVKKSEAKWDDTSIETYTNSWLEDLQNPVTE